MSRSSSRFQDHVYRPVQADPAMPAPAPVVSAAAMTRVQVLTPLSILVSAGTLIVTSILTRPRLNDVSEAHPTYLTPNATWLMAYWSVIYLCQIGFALLCVVGQKPETKVSGDARRQKWPSRCATGRQRVNGRRGPCG